jgi:hypothetical protein
MILRALSALRGVRARAAARHTFRQLYLEYLASPARHGDQTVQYALRTAFVASRGKNLKWAHKLQRKITRFKKSSPTSLLFPQIDEAHINKAVRDLRNDGYHVLPWRLSQEWLSAAIEAAQHLPVTSVSNALDVQIPISIVPRSATYWHANDILSVKEFSNFLLDEGIMEIAGRYLQCRPVIAQVAAWWTFPRGQADSASAQLYHFDLGGIKWLKVFVYMTDVGPENGPHAFIRGSHRTIGRKIWRDGRYTDEEVFSMYSKSDEVVFTAPVGTVLIEDTLGFHKGMPPASGHRFVFQPEYSINHFGYSYEDLQL